MTSDLEHIGITGGDVYPATESVKLHGPPGTGKTTQLAARVAVLLRDHGYSIDDVAWVTYRRSLADDVLERLAEWGVIDSAQLQNKTTGKTRYIGTIHAIANRSSSLGREVAVGWNKNEFCRDELGILFWGGERWEDTAGELLFRVFDWLVTNRYDPGEAAVSEVCPFSDDLHRKWPGGDITQAWAAWRDYKNANGLMDFHEMLSAPLRQNTWPTENILVVDEYHDATPLMARVCEHWMARADIVMVAADPDQVVNAYDGASPRFYERLGFPEVLLDTTYRVPENHWHAATGVLDMADSHSPPPVERIDAGGRIAQHRARPFERTDGAGWILPRDETAPPSLVETYVDAGQDVLFLARTKLQCEGIARSMDSEGMMYHTQGSMGGWNVYDTNAQKARNRLYDALSVLEGFSPAHVEDTNSGGSSASQRSLMDYQDTATDPPRDIDQTELSPGTFADLLEYTNAEYLKETRSTVEDECNSIRYGSKFWLPLSELTTHVTDEFWNVYTNGAGSVSSLNAGEMNDRHRRSLTNALLRHGSGHRVAAVGDITVLTIHAAKGHEADVVVLYDGITRSTAEAIEVSRESRENEYRTWFVGLTRASEELHVIRNGFEWAQPFLPSSL